MAIAKAPVTRLIKSTGASRVSGDAIDLSKESMEDYAVNVTRKANAYAHHAGRKTIKKADMKLALKD